MQFIPSFLFFPNSSHLKFQQCCSCPAYPSLKSLSIPHSCWISSQSIVVPVTHTWHFVSTTAFPILACYPCLYRLPMESVVFAIGPASWQKCKCSFTSDAPRATIGQARQWWKQQDSWTSQPAAPALWTFQSAKRKTHLPARFEEGVKRKNNGCAKCQMNFCLDCLRCPSGHDLWSSCLGSAG